MTLKLINEAEKEKIGVDIDEVLLNFFGPFLKHHNQRNNTKFSKQDIWNYNIWDTFGQTREFVISELNDFYTSSFFCSVTPIPGAAEGIRTLRERYALPVVTTRPTHIKSQTLVSLATFFNGSFNSGISFVAREEKARRYKELVVKRVIDDDLQVAKECSELGIEVLLVDKRWNQTKKLPERIIRVGDYRKEEGIWTEIQKILT